MKQVNLFDLVSIQDGNELEQKFIQTLCGYPKRRLIRYDEIASISSMMFCLDLPEWGMADGFYYGYSIPQISKEFDLLKFNDNSVLDIELKSRLIPQEKILYQLQKNSYYLGPAGRKEFLFTFVQESNTFYELVNGGLTSVGAERVRNVMSLFPSQSHSIDLDRLFAPSNYLVSPLNSPDRFLNGSYFLTDSQEDFKKKILLSLSDPREKHLYSIEGRPGTGKTLLLYDIGKTLATEGKQVLIIHCSQICAGQEYLNSKLAHFKIKAIKYIEESDLNNSDIVLIDEAHRLYIARFDKLQAIIQDCSLPVIFSSDGGQCLSYTEQSNHIADDIHALCLPNVYSLTTKIRTNKDLALFVTRMRDLSKVDGKYHYSGIHLFYRDDVDSALNEVRWLQQCGFEYISFTPSTFRVSDITKGQGDLNTHQAIGQEFEKVVMIMGPEFYYLGSVLSAARHPNPNYVMTQLLYQGLTRARGEIALVIYDNKDLLTSLLKILEADD